MQIAEIIKFFKSSYFSKLKDLFSLLSCQNLNLCDITLELGLNSYFIYINKSESKVYNNNKHLCSFTKGYIYPAILNGFIMFDLKSDHLDLNKDIVDIASYPLTPTSNLLKIYSWANQFQNALKPTSFYPIVINHTKFKIIFDNKGWKYIGKLPGSKFVKLSNVEPEINTNFWGTEKALSIKELESLIMFD